MKSKVLKFSHNFDKLYNQKKAVLVDVQIRRQDQLKPVAVDLDTSYKIPEEEFDEQGNRTHQQIKYQLPKSTLLMLTFIGDGDIPFTTYRKYSQAKWARLEQEAINKQEYEIVIEEAPDGEQQKAL